MLKGFKKKTYSARRYTRKKKNVDRILYLTQLSPLDLKKKNHVQTRSIILLFFFLDQTTSGKGERFILGESKSQKSRLKKNATKNRKGK